MAAASQIFATRSCNTLAEDGATNFHVDVVERAHDGLDPRLVDLEHEGTHGLLGLWTRRVRGNGRGRRAGIRGGRDGGGGRLVQEHELDVPARQETGDVVVKETVDALEIPMRKERGGDGGGQLEGMWEVR